MMSWTAILTALCLSIVSAYLVMIEGWAAWQALLYVGGGALLLIMSLLVIVMISTPDDDWRQFLDGIKHGFHEEWEAIIKWLRGK